MDEDQRTVRVTRTTELRSARGMRRLGQALIALAQTQLEAEAQAQAESKAARGPDKPAGSKRADERTRSTGDAA